MLACARQARAPDEISITGVDNTDLGATQTPGLTSVRTPLIEIGRAAPEQLIARLEGRVFTAIQSLPFDIVFRGNTGASQNSSRRRKRPPKPSRI